MKAIEFELDYTLPETGYYCTCCKHTEIDHSGKYYPAADYAALEAKLADLLDRIAELEALVQQHQTYQTKQGDK